VLAAAFGDHGFDEVEPFAQFLLLDVSVHCDPPGGLLIAEPSLIRSTLVYRVMIVKGIFEDFFKPG
jgi:hypothetical protein